MGMDQPYARALTTTNAYSALGKNGAGYDNYEVWGSLFWSIREKITQGACDGLLLAAWRDTVWPKDSRQTTQAFLSTMINSVSGVKAAEHVALIKEILKKRDFPVPK